MTRRWFILFAGLVACTNANQTGDTSDTDTDVDADSDADNDTDTDLPAVWVDRRIQTSSTLYGVYTGGTGAWVAGTGGVMWRIAQGSENVIPTSTEEDLFGLYGVGDDTTTQLVSVGASGTVLVYSASDGTFVRQDVGTPTFRDVDGTLANLTAVGTGGAYHWQGTEWTFEQLPHAYRLNSVWVASNGDAIAVGDDGAIVHRVGGVWSDDSVIKLAGYTQNFNAVYGSSDTDIWVVGELGFILHFDGTNWTQVAGGVGLPTLWGVWAAPTGEAFAVGNNGVALRSKAIEKSPFFEFEELPTGSDSNLYAVTGSNANNVWAVGNRGTILRYTGDK
jgi:hypothetical protein